jgi:F0F1-type ATP synthase assembly protein I
MAGSNGDRRPAMVVAMELASQAISTALVMALPAWAGYWGDQKLGTSPWLVVVGAVLGLTGGMLQLFRGLNRASRSVKSEKKNPIDPR